MTDQTNPPRTRETQIDCLTLEFMTAGYSRGPARHLAIAEIEEVERRQLAELRAGAEPFIFDPPEYHDQGMGCGLEDRRIHDRYEAMGYGWDQAVERCAEQIPDNLYAHPPVAREAELAAEVERLRAVLRSIMLYGDDTLSGNAAGITDASWYRLGVRELRDRARSSLAAAPEKRDV